MQKVLIVDDEASYRNLLKNVFVEHGYDVRTASGSKDAMAASSSFAPDVLIVDWMLSDEHDGLTVASHFRELNEEVGIVFVSGYPNQSLHGMQHDANVRWLAKPFHLDEVVAAVEAVRNPPSTEASNAN